MQRFVLLLLVLGARAASADAAAPARITLAEAVERALKASPTVAAARQRAQSARSEVAMARAMLGLHVSGGVIAGTSDRGTMLDAGGALGPVPGAMVGPQASAAVAGAAMFPIHTGGGLEAQLRRAQAMAAMAEADLRAEQATVAAEVKETFHRHRYASAMLRVAEADRDAARAMSENARAEWDAGRGIEASYLRAVARERAAEGAVAMAGAERAMAIIGLARAMGDKPNARIEPVDEPPTATPFDNVESAVRAAMESSPMLAVAQQRLASARHGVDAARASLLPQVYASLMGGLSTARGMEGRASGAAGLTAVLPLFDGGMRRQAVLKAQADRLAAQADADAVRLDAEAEVRMAWTAIEAAGASLTAARAAVEAARAAYSVIELRVQNQKAILVEQLDALMAVREAEEAVARAEFDRQIAIVKIERVIGRGR